MNRMTVPESDVVSLVEMPPVETVAPEMRVDSLIERIASPPILLARSRVFLITELHGARNPPRVVIRANSRNWHRGRCESKNRISDAGVRCGDVALGSNVVTRTRVQPIVVNATTMTALLTDMA